MKKLRVGVLMGGKSIEREVSFNSGRTVCDHLDSNRYEIIPLFQTKYGALYILPWKFLYRGKISDFEHKLDTDAQKISWDDLKQRIDFMYIAVHGRYAEDGTLQGFLDILDIPYLGAKTYASALGMNKIIQKDILALHAIHVAKGIWVSPEDVKNFETTKDHIYFKLESLNISLPYIVKPYHEGSSLGVSIVFEKEDLYDALLLACHADEYRPQYVLIEEKIEGMEFSCIVLTDYTNNTVFPLPPTEIVHENNTHIFDYEQKYMPGKSTKHTPARCSQEIIQQIQDTCVQTMKALEFTNIARIDGFVTHDQRIVIVDPNSLSGMAPSSFLFREAAEINMSHTDVINHLIKTELYNSQKFIAHNMLYNNNLATQTTMKNRQRIAVLFGGASNEKEISLESGRNIIYKLSPEKYIPVPVFVTSTMELYTVDQRLLVRNNTHEIETHLNKDTKINWSDLPKLADFVFIGLHGGQGENGSVQGALEMLDMPYNGSGVLTSALCMDKFKTNRLLGSKNIDVPAAYLLSKKEWESATHQEILARIIQNLSLPVIVKPHDDGCSVMVSKITTQDELEKALKEIFKSSKEFALIEECIMGMELTVGVIGNEIPQVLPPSQAVTKHAILSIQEKFLPGAGENQTPAPLTQEETVFVQNIIGTVYSTVQAKGYARIDCFYQPSHISPTGTQRLVIIEINTLPALTPATCLFHQASELGIKPMEFIDTLIKLGQQEHYHSTQDKYKEKEVIQQKVA